MLQLAEFAVSSFWIYCTLSVVLMVTLVTTLASCLCCRKQEIKNDLLGLEGMVKLTNPEDTLTSQGSTAGGDTGGAGTGSGTDQPDRSEPETINKRASNAPHRSLPDIPVVEPVGDNNSELYATVGDKVQDLPQATSSLKKQASVSQHSSISQADDISSPYARVRSPPHAYDKLRRTEHPYAQVVQPGTSGSTAQVAVTVDDELLSPISRRGLSSGAAGNAGGECNQSLLDEREASTIDIPAASAIAGRVSASQDLPYMTPPIVQQPQQHFSGDSQDSSKGYTSISVREPLANLLPQSQNQTTAQRRQILGDSHYATVSDDSDEMYAAIDDPNNQGDLYTSGSETYAQIQPPNMVTVSVEINTGASSRPSAGMPQEDSLDALQPLPMNSSTNAISTNIHNRLSANSGTLDEASCQPQPPSTDTLRTHQPHPSYAHSRQASSSSCTSSVGNLGSPKPEKRQANSPLPPTPKNLKHQSTNSFFSNSNLTSISSNTSTQTGQSGRNSAASVIEYKSSRENVSGPKDDVTQQHQQPNGSAIKPKKSPSKDLEGMYAKVMKKNKLSKAPSQNSSPVPTRKDVGTALLADAEQFLSDPELIQLNGAGGSVHGSPSKKPLSSGGNDYETIDKKQIRHNKQQHDPGYETIPGDNINGKAELRKSADYAQIHKRSTNLAVAQGIQSVSRNSLEIFHGLDKSTDGEPGYESLPSSNDPGYETLNRKGGESDSDPNYEILRPARNNDGYSSIRDPRSAKNRLNFGKDDDADSTPGYSSIKERVDYDPGYSVITEKKKSVVVHDYASITEETKRKKQNLNNNNLDPGEDSDIYSSITNAPLAINSSSIVSSSSNNYSTIPEPSNLTSSPGYSSISETRTTPSTDSTSSPDNLIGYTKQHNTVTNNSNSRLSSNYESLTGSESDPNYESVKYLNVKENPYERLHNEPSSGQTPSTAGPSSNDSLSKSASTDSATPGATEDTGSVTPSAGPAISAAKTPSVCELEATGVSDYFQV
ncbi:mucin-12 isoform X3 [Armigeres subalbatus]|uniref:mucin-12 isoform X3 n=1 Tax=Armigeres subalbatus TaxID=124917 RepID=UPI002ED3E460